MPAKRFAKEALRNEYNEKCPKYERLARNLKQAFESFLDEAGLDVLDVDFRIKNFDSFGDKIQRKGYKDPFQEIEDICGLRIICYYHSDLEKVSQIIKKEFDVLESVDKADLLEPDRFGYRSLHFIVTVRKDWLKAPNYRGLDGLKAEVQVRTILMHAWADVEHKLAYKKTEHIPDQFRRKLFRLSAHFESADDQLDGLRKDKEEYMKKLISEEVKESGRFDVSQDLNLDSLQAFLDFYFPDRIGFLQDTSDLLEDIMRVNISFKDLVEGFEKTKDILPLVEVEISKDNKKRIWAQVGIVRYILDITHNDYWQLRQKELPKAMLQEKEKWRAKLSKRNR